MQVECPILPDQRLEEYQQGLDEHGWVHNIQGFDVLFVPIKRNLVMTSCTLSRGTNLSTRLMHPGCFIPFAVSLTMPQHP